jgi:hypothetical protein
MDADKKARITVGNGSEAAEHGTPSFEVAKRLECVCLKHRFPFAATRPRSPRGSLCPEAKAPVKPDALQTLARGPNPQCPVGIHGHSIVTAAVQLTYETRRFPTTF